MPYVGNPLADAYSARQKQDLTGQSGTSFTLTHSVSSPNDLSVYINHVRQEPTTAYTVNGTTLTTTGTVAGTDDFYIIYDELALQSISHPTNQALTATAGTFTSGLVGTTATFSGALSATTGTFSGAVDIQGQELILDADGDTSITADTDDQIDFKIGGTDRMSISPEGKLSVTMTSTNTNVESDIGAVHILKNTSSTNSTGSMLCLGSNSNFGTGIYGQLVDNSTNEHKFGIQVRNSSGSSGTRMLITGAGKVGIGTTSPQDPLHTYLATGQRVARFEANNSTSAHIAFKASNTSLMPVVGVKDEALYFATNDAYERMRINDNGMIEIMTQNTGSAGSAINFGYRTTDFYATTTSSPTEQKKGGFAHFRKGGPDLDQTTNHFCNPTSDGWSMFYLAKLHDGGTDQRYFDFYWNTSSTSSIGTIKGNGSNIAYNTSSDYRLKENVVNSDLDKLYSQVKSLNVKTYNFKSTPDITQHGFLAHEAKDVWDYVCDTPKDAMKDDVEGGTKDADGNPAKVPDYQQLDYGKFTPMIMGALQKAMEKIETLEAKVKALEEA